METESTTFFTIEMENDTGSGYPDDYDFGTMICSKGWVRDFSRGYEPTLFLLIFILGTVGNLLVVLLYTGIRNRLKTMTDMYLLNLAVADLLFLATLPFWAVNALQGWAFGRHATGLCKAVVVVYKLNFFSSMLLLACISVDRYVAIVQVTRAHNLRRERRMLYSRVACLGVWLLSCLLAVPEVLFAKVRNTPGGVTVCDLLPGTETQTKVLVLSLQICVGFLLPLVVMTACYSLILRALLQSRSFHKHKALRVILAVVAVFVLSQLPYNGHLVVRATQFGNGSITDCGVATRMDVFGQVAKGLAYMHACVNPFLYVFVGVRFRRDLLGVLKSCAGRLGPGHGKMTSVAKRPSVMSDTETTAALSL
ncbi:C-C chemokine receptor type 9 [Gadus morhua]|uniref:G-protein coupled receptors family 1 profile domain-containing protein n=1 Tax=Gadus morhua TaxID=8049 RepID=A0A8C5F5H8_GADMO|nr:C-C chemokine receptor type 9-like [Gadus morhua]